MEHRNRLKSTAIQSRKLIHLIYAFMNLCVYNMSQRQRLIIQLMTKRPRLRRMLGTG